jgi:hypothetical protein
VVSTTFQSVFRDVFTPLPGTKTEETEQRKDPFDHIAEYADTTAGSWDLFRIGNHVFSVIELCLTPAHHIAGKLKEVFNTAGIGLSFPQLLSDVNALRRSVAHLFTVQDLPYNDPLRNLKIVQAVKKGFIDSMTLTNTMAQIALFVDNVKVFLFDAAHLRFIDGVYNVTSLITDGAELIGEYFKLKRYHAPEVQPRHLSEVGKLDEKKTLSWILIAKNVSSIALAVIAIGSIAFGVPASIFIISIPTLGISAFWLTMKLAGQFYNIPNSSENFTFELRESSRG